MDLEAHITTLPQYNHQDLMNWYFNDSEFYPKDIKLTAETVEQYAEQVKKIQQQNWDNKVMLDLSANVKPTTKGPG